MFRAGLSDTQIYTQNITESLVLVTTYVSFIPIHGAEQSERGDLAVEPSILLSQVKLKFRLMNVPN
jgi:hypothetical protein